MSDLSRQGFPRSTKRFIVSVTEGCMGCVGCVGCIDLLVRGRGAKVFMVCVTCMVCVVCVVMEFQVWYEIYPVSMRGM